MPDASSENYFRTKVGLSIFKSWPNPRSAGGAELELAKPTHGGKRISPKENTAKQLRTLSSRSELLPGSLSLDDRGRHGGSVAEDRSYDVDIGT